VFLACILGGFSYANAVTMVFFQDMPCGRPKKRKHSSSAPPCLQSPKKRLKWTNENMVKAMDAVKSGKCIVKRAAENYKVPRTTLLIEFQEKSSMEVSLPHHPILTKKKNLS